MWLHIGITRTEKFFSTITCDVLDDVCVGLSAVIAFARVALGILIGEVRAIVLADRLRDVVLRRNEFDALRLALFFAEECFVYFRILFLDEFEIIHRCTVRIV